MKTKKVCPVFGLVFFTVVSLTVLSGVTSLWIASQSHLTEYQARLLETSTATWLTGTGAVFGLLGGKTSQLLESAEHTSDDENRKGG